MLTNTHPVTTLIVKSATLAQAQSADKTCDWMAEDDYRNLAGGGGGEGQLLLFTFSLTSLCGDVITQHR